MLKQDEASELILFDQQPFVAGESLTLTADDKQLADFLP
jgi:hypothetical protein